ncbi:MAG: acyltransferase [Aeromicrobium sp.]
MNSIAGTDTMVPADRNVVIDVLRAGALLCVVVGHWLMQGVFIDGAGDPHRLGLLGLAPWSHPLTWVMQVMPIFFLAGGYANGVSWRRARRRRITYGTWLHRRTRRLAWPLIPLVALWSAVTVLAEPLGLDPAWVRIAGRASLVPVWFLAAYLLVIALVPVTLRLWDRLGVASIVAGLVLAGAVDVVSLNGGGDALGAVNVLVVWTTMHQVGYAWLDGTLRGRRRGLLMLGASLTTLCLLVWAGPYGVSMVGLDGHGVDNTSPPRVTLLVLGLAQAAVAVLAERRVRQLASRRVVWSVTVLVASRLMTIYLWHLTVLGLLLGLAMWTGHGLTAVPDTAAWWRAVPGWLAVLAVATAVVTRCVEPFERVPLRWQLVPTWWALTEVLAVSAGAAALARWGLVPPADLPAWVLPSAVTVVVLVVARGGGRRGTQVDRAAGDLRPSTTAGPDPILATRPDPSEDDHDDPRLSARRPRSRPDGSAAPPRERG